MTWVTSFSPSADDVNTCVQCGLCLPACPTFRLTASETASPRGRLTAMFAVEQGMPIDEHVAGIMGSCLQCRACEVVCPAFVPFGKAMEGMRAEIQAQHRVRWRGFRRLVTTRIMRRRRLLRLGSRLAGIAALVRLTSLAPAPLRSALTGLRPSPGGESILGIRRSGSGVGVAALVSGCVMDAWFTPVHEATIDLLQRAGYDVVVPENQTCCGALAAHDGFAAEASEMASTNVSAFESVDIIVANAAGCGAHLKEYDEWADGGESVAGRTKDITELVAAAIANGSLPALEGTSGRVGVQDPCHLRHAQRITDQPRAILRAAGYEVVDIDPSGTCCGAAGLYSVLEPGMSGQLGQRKAEEIDAVDVDVVASANPGCEMQLRSYTGGSVRIAHPVELYHQALEDASR